MTEMPDPRLVPEWTLGWRLQRSLAHAEITVPEMADKLNVTRQTVRRWATDLIVPKPIYVKEWALICGVPYSWLAYGHATGPTAGGEELLSDQFRNGRGSSRRSLDPRKSTYFTLITPAPLTWELAA
jgi:transcriptional regulator with XRE-family HTH domain